ncbi:hypothetical protein AAC387_Pa02g3169 [Persea americana]
MYVMPKQATKCLAATVPNTQQPSGLSDQLEYLAPRGPMSPTSAGQFTSETVAAECNTETLVLCIHCFELLSMFLVQTFIIHNPEPFYTRLNLVKTGRKMRNHSD